MRPDETESQDIPPSSPIVARPVTEPAAAPPGVFTAPSPLLLREIAPRAAALDLALILLTALIAPHALDLLFAVVRGPSVDFEVGWLVVAAKWFEALLVVGLAAYLVLRTGVRPASLGLRFDRPLRQVGWGVLALVPIYGYMLASAVVVLAILLAIPGWQDDLRHRVDMTSAMPTGNLGLTLMLLVPVAIHEEVLFRALLIPYLRRVLGSWGWAVLVSSVVFGVLHIHQGAIGCVQITGLAVVLAVLFIATRSIIVVVVAHYAFDFAQFQLIRLLGPVLEQFRAAT